MPSPVSRTPGRHRIDVRVKRTGAKVSARRGYIVEAPAPNAAPSPTVDDSLLRRTLLGSAPQGKLRLTVHAVPRFATGKRGAVTATRSNASKGSVIELTGDVAGRMTLDAEGHIERIELANGTVVTRLPS